MPRLLRSIADLNAPVFILDSGSTDGTLAVAEQYGAYTAQNKFVNHPQQWDYALKNLGIKTPWLICLDADQIVGPDLLQKLKAFDNEQYLNIDGIYFNRKYSFKGKWIKHGGYYPFYQLKMFRYGVGYSDLNENMDHRFIVPGNTIIWKDGVISEENFKENRISFWLDKHNRYSDLVAQEEVERMLSTRYQTVTPNLFGSPDERTAWRKQLWWKLPRYMRPILYLIQRMIFQLGFLDGRTGIIYHFLQSFWFRLIVDVKIDELLKDKEMLKSKAVKFSITFVALFLAFYYFNIGFFSITSPESRHYNAFIADNFNYIRLLRRLLLSSTSFALRCARFASVMNEYQLRIAGYGGIRLVYSCLGLGLMSFFSAFVIAYPKALNKKLLFLFGGLLAIQVLNVLRMAAVALFWGKEAQRIIDHHVIFNGIIYVIIAIALYFWVTADDRKKHATN